MKMGMNSAGIGRNVDEFVPVQLCMRECTTLHSVNIILGVCITGLSFMVSMG